MIKVLEFARKCQLANIFVQINTLAIFGQVVILTLISLTEKLLVKNQ